MQTEENRSEERKVNADREAQTTDRNWAAKKQMASEAIGATEAISGSYNRRSTEDEAEC